MPTSSDRAISLRIIIAEPPDGILYGIQMGSGNSYETLQKQMSGKGDIVFELTIPVKVNKEGSPVLAGPFVQGAAKDRFLYVDIGSYAGQTGTAHNGRLKIPLPELTEAILKQVEKGGQLMAHVPGTNPKNGQPSMATVRPIGEWMVMP